MNVFGFKSKKGEILDHWISFADGFTFPSQEFYERIEKEISARQIPSMDMSRVEFAEGGVLSARRTYLRMIRERLAFDACAAPFGNVYFFSCRTIYIPAVLKLWHFIAMFLVFGLVFSLLYQLLGFTFSVLALVGLLLAILQIFQNAIGMGLSDLDSFLMKIPALGPIYERLFRKETYYREDTRLLYLKILPDLIKEIAEEIVAAKGVKLKEQYRRAPVLGELYKREPREEDAKDA
jgi:hypothetical protein